MIQKHIHKLKKHKYPNTGTEVFFCVNNCTFKIEKQFALGKETECWQCGNPFIINEYTIKLSKPHCSNCGKIAAVDSDGKKVYVRKQSANKVIAATAQSDVDDLKNRLGSLTGEGDI